MTVDGNHSGQIVAYAVVSNETGDTVTKLLEVFVSDNIAVKEKIETVMIDKDFAKMKAIKAVLPGANILICKFHVLRAIQRAMKDFSSTERDSVLAIIRKMMMCSSEEQYIELQIELQMDSPRFMMYFIKKLGHLQRVMGWSFCSPAHNVWQSYKQFCGEPQSKK